MIHPTASIHPSAKILKNVEIGPYVVIGEGVEIGEQSSIHAHSILQGPNIIIGKNNEIGPNTTFLSDTIVGDGNRFLPFATVGAPPQDLKFSGENSRIEIGNSNIFREFVTINRGTAGGGGVTRVGNQSFIMSYVHVAHDCQIGDGVIIANSVGLAGHVQIEDYAIIGGMVGIAQFCRVGTLSYVGAYVKIAKDIPPFTIAAGKGVEVSLKGINSIGLRRRGRDAGVIRELKNAFKILFVSDLTLQEGLTKARNELAQIPEIRHLIEYIEGSKPGVISYGKNEKYVEENQDSRYWRRIPGELSL